MRKRKTIVLSAKSYEETQKLLTKLRRKKAKIVEVVIVAEIGGRRKIWNLKSYRQAAIILLK